MKFHIHIYEVKSKYEIDIEANNPIEAKTKAIEMYKTNKEKLIKCEKDCDIIVLAFNEKGEEV